jgi:phenylalanyl-tRNA synthetase alpha chain
MHVVSSRGTWQELEFKEYNFNALGQPTEGGHLHPLLKVCSNLHSYFHYALKTSDNL